MSTNIMERECNGMLSLTVLEYNWQMKNNHSDNYNNDNRENI